MKGKEHKTHWNRKQRRPKIPFARLQKHNHRRWQGKRQSNQTWHFNKQFRTENPSPFDQNIRDKPKTGHL